MAVPAWMRRQMDQILELDMEELEVEEVDDSGSSSSSDVATFLRNTHGDGETSTSGEFTVNMSRASLNTYVGEIDDTRGRFAFLDGGALLSLPMLSLQGFVLFPEATLTLRVTQPRFAAAVDKAINHVDNPCMIGVILEIRRLDDGSTNVITRGQQRFRLRRSWVDIDEVPWGEIQIIEEDMPLRTPRDAFGQLAASNTFKQCDSSVHSLGVSCFKQKDLMDSDLDLDSLSCTSTSSDHSVTDTGIYYSSNEDEYLMPELSWQKHGSVNEFGALSQPVKDTTIGDDDDLCFASPESLSTVREKDAGQQRQYRAAYNSKMAPLSFWPRWVYNMYDSSSLARKAADLWNQIIAEPGMDDYVRKPDILSFLIGSKLPVSASMRQELLDIDGVSYRLQREIQLLKAFNLVRCRNCLALIARRSDMVIPSSVDQCGPHVMPLLYKGAQEVITVHNTSGLALHGNPSDAHSWFPGYDPYPSNMSSVFSFIA
ncbi:Protein cereblon [Triticum urartu]|uniref:Protein cereblon n=1 Tax=Triticum urartu TaxID=4572 RepID=M8A8D5_TRIUA|nr:Protein cereblon [Triticum urartu]